MLIPHPLYNRILEVMPILCVDLVIVARNKCLLIKRNNEPAKGQYWLPGGRIHKMETIQKAALRKAREEVNLDCKFLKIVSVEETVFRKRKDMHTAVHSVNFCCWLRPLSIREIKVDQLHSDPIWVNLIMAQSMNLHPAVIHPIKKCLA